ncbi:uncharacterized protein LOC121179011 isoform X2 [Toxotes jaculatrix]|uniref:uncharacterized protein LOC121179011 isoform X2 n=1 Tax=Toxotes jaculatrix TaxID=941984 RepID=UPI001B3AA6EF|nr:uncharacterized protein LOC121179011 isoform X2 [Toxotes jaculatrix]
MAGHLLFVVLMYSFSENKAQVLLPPTLTVNPLVITDSDSVTLNCQTPSSVSASHCYFRFVRGGPAKSFSCLKTLSGTELLLLTHQTLPAEVKVTCFYLDGYQSQESIMSSIIIQNPQPKLTVNPLVITETDSVTLKCQTPSFVSVSQCLFYTVKEQNTRVASCLKTLTGTELLNMAHQSSPAVVEVTCYYTAEHRGGQYQSPQSNISSITIQTLPPPTLTVNPPMIRETDSVTLNCQTPSSVSVFHCYFITVKGQTLNVLSCLTTLTGAELLHTTHQSSPAEVKLTCYYRVKVFSATSPHSDISSITINNPVKEESHTTQTVLTFALTTDETSWIIGAAVTVGVPLLGLALLFIQIWIEKCVSTRPKANVTDDREYMADFDETYSIVTYQCNFERQQLHQP